MAIRLAALGVAVWRIGLLMVGLTRAVGGLVLTGEEGGEDITETGEEEVVTAVAVEGEERLAVEGSLLVVVAAVVVILELVVVVAVDSAAGLDWEKGDTVTVVTELVLLGSDFLKKGDWSGWTGALAPAEETFLFW